MTHGLAARLGPGGALGWVAEEAAPFGSCSGEGWAFSVSSGRSSRALSLPSELSRLSSPSTLSRAVGRAYGGRAGGAAEPGASAGGRGPGWAGNPVSWLPACPPTPDPEARTWSQKKSWEGPETNPHPTPTPHPPGLSYRQLPYLDVWGFLWLLHPQLLLIHVAQLGFHFV